MEIPCFILLRKIANNGYIIFQLLSVVYTVPKNCYLFVVLFQASRVLFAIRSPSGNEGTVIRLLLIDHQSEIQSVAIWR